VDALVAERRRLARAGVVDDRRVAERQQPFVRLQFDDGMPDDGPGATAEQKKSDNGG